MSKMIDYALWYAEQGLAVFPIKYKGKTPITTSGFKEASTDPRVITEWWTAHPHANIGIATGKASGGVFVIDLDVNEDTGVNGYDSLRDWERENGSLPDTALSLTGRGGNHIFYRSNRPVSSRIGVLDGIDVRGDGGYIVAPPSLHSSGNRYQWEQEIEEYGIADADENVYKLLALGKSEEGARFQVGETIGEGKRNETLYKMACSFQAKGMADETILLAIQSENRQKCNPPLEDDEVLRIVESALTKKKGGNLVPTGPFKPSGRQYISLDKTVDRFGNEKVTQSIENSCRVLREDEELRGKIRINELSYNIHIAGTLPWSNGVVEHREWTDADDSNLLRYIEHNYKLKNKENTLRALDIVSHENSFNPVIEHLETLPPWDGKPRIENLLPDYLGVEKSEYTHEAMKMFMLGAIARAYTPGCKFDYMLVLVGDQGIGKSTFLRELAMSPIWYDDNFNTVEGDKAVERLRGMWFVELAELLAAKRTKEVESIKAFLTSTVDSYRPPYARRTIQRPRRCVFAGTTNNLHFLTDVTGNRRYLPVLVNKANVKKSLFENREELKYEIEQAWAEALHIYKTEKPRLIMPKKLHKTIEEEQTSFLEEDPRVGIIQEWLDNTSLSRICVMHVWEYALELPGKPSRRESNEVHDILRNSIVGWKAVGRRRTREYGVQHCYERVGENGFYEVVGENF